MIPWRRDWRAYLAAAVLILSSLATAVVVSSARDRHDALTALANERAQERTLVAEITALKHAAATQASTLDYLTREIAALRRQIRQLGAKPVEVQRTRTIVVSPEPEPSSSFRPAPKPSPRPTPTRSPSPSPTGCAPLPTCPPARGITRGTR